MYRIKFYPYMSSFHDLTKCRFEYSFVFSNKISQRVYQMEFCNNNEINNRIDSIHVENEIQELMHVLKISDVHCNR